MIWLWYGQRSSHKAAMVLGIPPQNPVVNLIMPSTQIALLWEGSPICWANRKSIYRRDHFTSVHRDIIVYLPLQIQDWDRKKKTCHAQEANEEWGHNNGGENVVPLIQGILSWKMLARTYKSYNPYYNFMDSNMLQSQRGWWENADGGPGCLRSWYTSIDISIA